MDLMETRKRSEWLSLEMSINELAEMYKKKTNNRP